MKTSNFFRSLVIIFITTTVFFSCTGEEDNPTSGSIDTSKEILLQRGKNELDDLRTFYADVVIKSKSYIDFNANIRGMADNLKNVSTSTIENRTDFKNWITAELSKTKFKSVNEAMAYYDLTIASYDKYVNEHGSFFKDIDELTNEEIGFVIQDGSFSPPVATNANPCQNGCMDTVSATLDSIENTRRWRKWWQIVKFLTYWSSIETAIDDFNACMSGC